MRNTCSFLLATFFMAVLFIGCKEKPVTTPGDLENPKIIMTSPVELPEGQYIEIYSTDSFFVDIRFEDDKALKSWEITVRFNSALYYLRTNDQPWKETWFSSLSGKADGINFKEYVSYDPTAGPYEFTVTVTDSAGKTATKKTYFFVHNRANLGIPVVTYSNPDTNNIDTFAIGQQIPIMAQVTDPTDQIKDAYLRIRDKVTLATMDGSEIRWDTVYAAPLLIDTFVTVPAGTVPGNYNIEIYGNDQTYNLGYKACEIYIKPN